MQLDGGPLARPRANQQANKCCCRGMENGRACMAFCVAWERRQSKGKGTSSSKQALQVELGFMRCCQKAAHHYCTTTHHLAQIKSPSRHRHTGIDRPAHTQCTPNARFIFPHHVTCTMLRTPKPNHHLLHSVLHATSASTRRHAPEQPSLNGMSLIGL